MIDIDTDHETLIEDLVGRKPHWTPIIVDADPSLPMAPRLVELAKARRWKLISLFKFNGRLPANLRPGGALVTSLPSDPLVCELLKQGVPTVRIGRWPHPQDDLVPAVMTDWLAIGQLAAEHFAQRSFRDVAFVGQDPWGHHQPLFEAFSAKADELGMACHLMRVDQARLNVEISAGRSRLDVIEQSFTAWFQALPKPLGLLGAGDIMADRYCQWLCDAGLRVPEDVAILGIGDTSFVCECALVPLSSLAFDYDGIARTAFEMLARLMAGQALDQTTVTVPPVGVTMRQSTDVLAAPDPQVAEALRFIWDNIASDLSVDKIARHVGVSRRTLERAFDRELGRGIHEEFQRRRMDKACDLLTQTKMPIGDLAQAMNFSSHTQFGRAFRNAFGLSPARYRREYRAGEADKAHKKTA